MMNKKWAVLIVFLCSVAMAAVVFDDQIFLGNVQIQNALTLGTSDPHASAVFDVQSTTKGSSFAPTMSESERDNISSPQTGLTIFNSDTNAFNFYNGAVWTEIGTGGGSGVGVQYINEDFEEGVTNLVAYADTAGATPVDGTGGSPNVTVTAETSNPVIGDQSAKIAKDASDRQGEGVAILSSTVDEAYEDKVHTVEFQWKTDANYADGDMALFVVHPTTGTVEALNFRTALGEFTNELPKSDTTVTRIISELTPIDPTYRIVLHVASTSATAYEVFVDNIQAGPQRTFNAPIVTEWQDYTPTLTGFGTVTNVNYRWRRVGSTLQVEGRHTNGTPTATEARISFPNSVTATSNIATLEYAGELIDSGTGISTDFRRRAVLKEPSVSYFTFGRGISGSVVLAKANGNEITGASANVSIKAEVPIQGWDAGAAFSTTQVDQQTVKVRVYQNSAQTLANNTHETLDFNVVEKDEFNLYDTTGDYIEVPRDGWAYVHVASQVTGLAAGTGSTDVGIQLDSGTGFGFISLSQPNPIEQSSAGETASIFKYFNKGDKIRGTQRQTNGASRDTTGSEFRNYMEFFMHPDFSVFGTFPEKNLVQTKLFNGTHNTNDAISSLTCSNLTVGKLYKIQLQAALRTDVGAANNTATVNIVHNSNIEGRALIQLGDSEATTDILIMSATALFKATASTVTIEGANLDANSDIIGDGTKGQTYVTIKEYNDLRETSKF